MSAALAGGGVFGVLSDEIGDKSVPVYAASALRGVAWWLVGALLIMPLWLGVTADSAMSEMVFVVGGAQWVSLFDHVCFGMAMGATLLALRRVREAR